MKQSLFHSLELKGHWGQPLALWCSTLQLMPTDV